MRKRLFFLIFVVFLSAGTTGAATPISKDDTPEKEILQLIKKASEQHQDANYEEALSSLHKALARSKKIENTILSAKAGYALAIIHFELGDLAASQKQLNKIFKLEAKLDDSYVLSLAHLLSSQIELKNQQLKKAESHLTKATEIISTSGKDQLTNSTETSKKTASLAAENSKQQRSLQLNKFTTILGITMILIVSLLTVAFFKNRTIRAKTTALLLAKNKQLTREKNKAEQATLAKTQFLSTITHELRTPIYAVTGLTHLLINENPTEEQKEHLDSLRFSGEHLLSLINNILDFNKLEAQKVIVQPSSFNLKEKIENILSAMTNSANDKNNTFHLELDDSLPEKVIGDHVKISQVLINLISNAVRFTQNGDIWIRVKQMSVIEDQVLVYFEVEDNGIGIPDRKKDTIFENFTQGSEDVNNTYGGTGLGLPIVKGILQVLGAEIKLESSLDVGSKFFFTLKLEKVKDSLLSETQEKEQNEINLKVWQKKLEGKKILIVEDNKINQMITLKILKKHHILCELADDGESALEKTNANQYDLILMDIHMPGINGIQTTQEIRKTDSRTPIIALTAVAMEEDILNFVTKGFDDVIPKPYRIAEFFQKIHDQIYKTHTV